MYLYSRSTRLAPGRTREAMAFAVGLTERVNQISELDVSLWTRVLSPGVGILSWTAAAQDLEEIEASMAKIAVDDAFNAEAERGAQFAIAGSDEESLLQLVHGELDPQARPQYVSVAVSQLLPGQLAKGVEIGVEIAKKGEALSGVTGLFAVGLTGPYGAVAWISGHESLKALDASEQAVNADPGFTKLIDSKGSTAFDAGATERYILQRIV